MTVYLHPHIPPQTNIYPVPKSRPRSRISHDENQRPANGSPSYPDLYKFIPDNLPLNLSVMHRALLMGDGQKAWSCINARIPFPFIENGVSMLVLAIKNCSQYKQLIANIANCVHPDGINYTTDTTALIEACKLLDEDLVTFLLHKGAKPNKRTELQMTPLNCAVRLGSTTEISESGSEQIELTNRKLFAVAQALLRNKADVDFPDILGNTPLQTLFNKILPEQISPPIVSLLIAYGADPNIVKRDDSSPTHSLDIDKAVERGITFNRDRLAEEIVLKSSEDSFRIAKFLQ